MKVSLVNKMMRKAGPKVQAAAPHVAIIGGVIGLAATGVLIGVATWKAKEVVEESKKEEKELLDSLDKVSKEELTPELEEQFKQSLASIYMKRWKKVLKMYGPVVALGVASIMAIIGGHKSLAKRIAGLTSAFTTLNGAFKQYRQRVVDDQGKDKDREYRYGVKTETVTETVKDEQTGKNKKVEKTRTYGDPSIYSQYAVIFDESSTMWTKSAEKNKATLIGIQRDFNKRLEYNGYVFLNDVYAALGLPKTKAGQVVGWSKEMNGDGYIDFGIFDVDSPRAKDFVNGFERSIILDFNVDGVILDAI